MIDEMEYKKKSQEYVSQKIHTARVMSTIANDAFIRNEFGYSIDRLSNIVGDVADSSDLKIAIDKKDHCKGRKIVDLCVAIEILEAKDKVSMVSDLDSLKSDDLGHKICEICDKYTDLAYAISRSE